MDRSKKLETKDLKMQDLFAYWAHPNTPQLVEEVRAKRRDAKRIRHEVDAYKNRLLRQEFAFVNKYNADRITDHRMLHRSEQEEMYEQYLVRAHEEDQAHGYDVPREHCPALIAEDKARKAEDALLDHVAEFIPFAAKFHARYGDIRERLLHLMMNPPKEMIPTAN